MTTPCLSTDLLQDVPFNLWCYGPPGSGKREFLLGRYGCHIYFHKPFSKRHYSTYADEPVLCICNYGGSSPYQRYTLTRWTSGTPIPLRTRQFHSRTYAKPKILCVISDRSPQEVFAQHPTLLRRIMDRFIVYKFPRNAEEEEQESKE